MPANNMSEDQIIIMHLSKGGVADGMTVESGFRGCLQDARRMTGRDIETGDKLSGERQGSWLGAIGYMTLLDQIGSCFKPKSTKRVGAPNTIERALLYFSALSQAERQAIYALRCAFTHDYSLYNINKVRPQYAHQFAVEEGANRPVVILPQQQWDGDPAHRNQANQTTVNLEALGDLVEGICQKLFSLAQNQKLELVLKGGAEELLDRYWFAYPEDLSALASASNEGS